MTLTLCFVRLTIKTNHKRDSERFTEERSLLQEDSCFLQGRNLDHLCDKVGTLTVVLRNGASTFGFPISDSPVFKFYNQYCQGTYREIQSPGGLLIVFLFKLNPFVTVLADY